VHPLFADKAGAAPDRILRVANRPCGLQTASLSAALFTVIGALLGLGGPGASYLWLLTLSLLLCCAFHSRHQISEPLPLLPFTFVLWFGLGASDAPSELT